MEYETVYSFKTKRFTVALAFAPCYENPLDCFDSDEMANDIIEGINSGRYIWFDARITVSCDGREIAASDYLGACCYASAEDFRRDGYFRDMVREACKEARRVLANPPRLRAAG